ncbi:hypothetical protein SEA_CRACKLEWINK_125 [Mycobacterium phage Cracklewink]|nr:hypothetical protein SEA_CRACKLEWINK_125 [Mycobacterium phage Cracklewink]
MPRQGYNTLRLVRCIDVQFLAGTTTPGTP